MKPRNNTERRVVELSATLPSIRQYDADRIQKDFIRTYKGKGFCYYLILERCKEYQVIRYYYKSQKELFEFMQIWMNEESSVVLAKNRFMRVDSWVRDSEMTIKNWLSPALRYSYLGGVERIGFSGVFVRSLLPSLKQRGLKTSTHGIHPYYLCKTLFESNRLETLFKLRQYLLVWFFGYGYREINRYWQAIRVALRHGYHWDNKAELSDWCDMVNDLQYLKLDTCNPHYICPANLSEAHAYYNERRRKVQETKRLQEEMEKIAAYEPIFAQDREQFYDFALQSGKITIQIIPTALAIKEEGIAMHHCVGNYYDKPASLILSAKVDGKRMETIEVNLDTYEIEQSRGLQNKYTSYHNRIMRLMKQGLPEIRKRNEEHKLKIAV